ncbi:TolC family protein [Sorangium sp. So ce295]|uniref:TolC family protein n=1 Tax=Sorangium sp. So ce295 TaxID=3133295 RepID=UPI003F5FFC80
MGPVSQRRRRAAIPVMVLCAALSGCSSPPRPAASDRAIALYREGRASAGAPALRRAGPGARPGASSAGPIAMTVEDAVAWARDHSAELAAQSARAEAAAAQVDAEDHLENPELRITNIELQRIRERDPRVSTALRFPVTRPGEVDANVAEARVDEAKALAEAREIEIALEADIRSLFDEVLLFDAEIAAADAVAEARRSLATWMKGQLAAARTTAVDEAMTELTAVDAEQDGVDLRAQRSAALAALLSRMGLDPAVPVRLLGAPKSAWPPPELPTEAQAVELALKRRPEIELAAAQGDAADATLQAERAARWPWLSFVEVGYDFRRENDLGLGWTFGLAIELPVFDTHRAATVAADTARKAEQRALGAAVELVTREVRTSLSEAQATRALVTELRRRMNPAAERAGAEAQRAIEGRNVDVGRALEVDERRVRLELRLLRFVRRYWTAVGELRHAVGGRLPAEAGHHGRNTEPGSDAER